ncbi:nitroreductase family protein [Maribacter vaceletii]|uniref:nitroreductase family protein n=1 Tax=Maribacter vaceletii TaxID=1206816 RepID=UPI0029370209|nr:nitroreductase family protein [Maribacter vaceletii]
MEKDKWTSNQTYIALGNLLNACAELKIDACPMEGFEREKYNDILALKKQGLNTSVVATIGYRSDNDTSQHTPKVRKSIKSLFA